LSKMCKGTNGKAKGAVTESAVEEVKMVGLPPMSFSTRLFFWAMERYRGWIMTCIVTPASFVSDSYMEIRDYIYRCAVAAAPWGRAVDWHS
jgi:hypothetical protein